MEEQTQWGMVAGPMVTPATNPLPVSGTTIRADGEGSQTITIDKRTHRLVTVSETEEKLVVRIEPKK